MVVNFLKFGLIPVTTGGMPVVTCGDSARCTPALRFERGLGARRFMAGGEFLSLGRLIEILRTLTGRRLRACRPGARRWPRPRRVATSCSGSRRLAASTHEAMVTLTGACRATMPRGRRARDRLPAGRENRRRHLDGCRDRAGYGRQWPSSPLIHPTHTTHRAHGPSLTAAQPLAATPAAHSGTATHSDHSHSQQPSRHQAESATRDTSRSLSPDPARTPARAREEVAADIEAAADGPAPTGGPSGSGSARVRRIEVAALASSSWRPCLSPSTSRSRQSVSAPSAPVPPRPRPRRCETRTRPAGPPAQHPDVRG